MNKKNSLQNHNELQQFWGLSRLLMMGMVQRFNHNVRRYSSSNNAPEENPAKLLSDILYQTYVFRNSLATIEQQSQSGGALLVIGQKIHHLLYRLHHRLLDFDADEIAALIPEIDEQLSFWNPELDSPEFLEADQNTIEQSINKLQELRVQLNNQLN